MSEARPGTDPTLKVWDPLVRIGHWLLALSVLLTWLTREGGGAWHERIGYASLIIIGIRLLWGWKGTRYARFADFLRGPRLTLEYAGQMLRGREPHYVGHNPLGGWMIMALLVTTLLVGLSGWLYTTDRYWGVAWVETVHGVLANTLLVFVALHVAGVLYASYRHRENLIAAMFHGRKRPARAGSDE